MDVRGAVKIKSENECSIIFIIVGNLEELEKRLIERGTDDMEIIKKRMEEAKKEISFSTRFDTIIVNENEKLEEAVASVSEFILFE